MGCEIWGAFEELNLKRIYWSRNRGEKGKWSASSNAKFYQGDCIKVSCKRGGIYRMYHHILSWVLEAIYEVFLTEKCYTFIKIGTIFSGNRTKGRRKYCVSWNLRM
jgi:hypothetical protein